MTKYVDPKVLGRARILNMHSLSIRVVEMTHHLSGDAVKMIAGVHQQYYHY